MTLTSPPLVTDADADPRDPRGGAWRRLKRALKRPLGRPLGRRVPGRWGWYAALALIHWLATWSWAYVAVYHPPFRQMDGAPFLLSDAAGYWAYLPSVVIDRDLDLRNQRYLHGRASAWRAEAEGRFEEARLKNKWPIGVALTASPGFAAAHVVTWGAHHVGKRTGGHSVEVSGYGPLYVLFAVTSVYLLVLAGCCAADVLLTERLGLSGAATAAGVTLLWLATNFQYYLTFLPIYAHASDAAWVMLTVFATHRTLEQVERGRLSGRWLAAVVFFAAMAGVTRLTNGVVLAPLGGYLGYRLLRFVMGRRAWGTLLVKGWVVLPAMFPLALQGLTWQSLGAWQSLGGVSATPAEWADDGQTADRLAGGIGYRPEERFYWSDPAMLRTLFSTRAGLFTWSPVLLVAVWGVWRLLRRATLPAGGRAIVTALVIGAIGLWYVNASWYAWWFGNSFGGRAFVSLAILAVIGLASAAEGLRTSGRGGRGVVFGVLTIGVVIHYALLIGYVWGWVDRGVYLWEWERRTAVGAWERV